MNTETEFATVELILNTPLETRAIDAFALSIIKSERQVRRIFSYLIYQHPNYGLEDSKTIRSILSKNKKMYLRQKLDLTVSIGIHFKKRHKKLN